MLKSNEDHLLNENPLWIEEHSLFLVSFLNISIKRPCAKDKSDPMSSECKGVSFGRVNVIKEEDAVL